MRPRAPDLFALFALGSSTVYGFSVRARLPELVPTHFDMYDVANGFTPRAVAVVLLPAIALLTWALVRFLPRVLPRREQSRLGEKNLALVAAMPAVFLSFLHVCVLTRAMDGALSITRAVWLGLGALFVGLGLVLPRVGRNAFVGIRTAWTLASDENWARTHRVAGYTLALGGLLAAPIGAFGGPAGTVVAAGVLVVMALVPTFYSLHLARKSDAS